MNENKCIWCAETIEDGETMCNKCSYEAMSDIEREELNYMFDED